MWEKRTRKVVRFLISTEKWIESAEQERLVSESCLSVAQMACLPHSEEKTRPAVLAKAAIQHRKRWRKIIVLVTFGAHSRWHIACVCQRQNKTVVVCCHKKVGESPRRTHSSPLRRDCRLALRENRSRWLGELGKSTLRTLTSDAHFQTESVNKLLID